MRTFFGCTLAVLLLLSLIAWRTGPRPLDDGRTVLTWVSDDNPFRRQQIAPFNQLHPEYDLRLDPTSWGMEKVIVQCTAGVGPDLFDCYGPAELAAYARAGVAWDVTDELAKRGIDVQRDTWPGVHPTCMLNGRAYGFPTNAAVNALWFHKDLFDEAGLPYPSGEMTWDQFVTLAQKLTLRDPATGRITRYGFICDWYLDYMQYIFQAGGHFYADGGTRCVVDSPEAIAGVQFLADLVHKYHVAPSFGEELAMATQGGWGVGPQTLFGGKRAAMASGGRYWLCTLRTRTGLRLGVSEAPHGPVRVFRGYGKATLVNAASPHRQQALDFLAYQNSQAYNDVVNANADGVGPSVRFTETDAFLHDPAHPDEDYNLVWREMQRRAIPDETSPFVNGSTMKRITEGQLDLIKSGDLSPAQGLHNIARQINAEIQETVRKNPELKHLYEERLAKSSHEEPATK